MKILLINNNPSISKLINLTAKKYGYDLDELVSINGFEQKDEDVVFIDDTLSEETDLNELRNLTNCDEFVYIGKKNSIKPNEYKYMLTKPFLPSDFHNIVEDMSSLKNVAEEVLEDNDLIDSVEDEELEKEEFKIDNIGLENVSNVEENSEEDISLKKEPDENKEILEEPEEVDNFGSLDENGIESKKVERDIPKILDKEDIEEVKELLNEEENNIKEVESVDNSKEDIVDAKDLEIEDLNIDDENNIQAQEINEDVAEQTEPEDKGEIKEKNQEDELKSISLEIDEDMSEDKTNNDEEENELNTINEENLKELFDDNSKIDKTEKEENMYIETIKKVKKIKKPKKSKKINDAKIKEDIISKLLDIDTLREVLDGMEIRIKFYNKNKKK